MKKYENEEYCAEELQSIDEMQYFEAEDYKSLELLNTGNEDFKVLEIEKREVQEESVPLKPKKDQTETLRKKINNLKTSINSGASSSITASVLGVTVAVGIGVIMPTPVVEAENIEFMHYVVDYDFDKTTNFLEKNVRLYFEGELKDGYYCVVINEETEEEKILDSNMVSFENLTEEQYKFNVKLLDKDNNMKSEYKIDVNTKSDKEYRGLKEIDYMINLNEDDSANVYLDVEKESDFINLSYLLDGEGNFLDYSILCNENEIIINGIMEDEFSVYGGTYYQEAGNYYAISNYKLENINKYIDIELERVEILNDSYDYLGLGSPTQLYFDGHITTGSYFAVIVYDEYGTVIDEKSMFDALEKPVVFHNLPKDMDLKFEFISYGQGNEISRGEHTANLSVKEEYLNAKYNFNMTNPGDVFVTYNDDLTYNIYTGSLFENESTYDIVYKLELTAEIVNENDEFETTEMFSYIGNEEITLIKDIIPNNYYAMIYKVFVKDGINHYVVCDRMSPSGTIDVFADEEGFIFDNYVYIEEYEPKIFKLSFNGAIFSDVVVTAKLSSGNIITQTYSKDSFNDYENIPLLDLSSYEFENVEFTIEFNGNKYYGLGDYVLEKENNIIGKIYLPIIYKIEY